MHVLTILDHPDPNSFTVAAARSFMEGATAAGHTTELGDLHAEGFDPRWSMADVEGNLASDALSDVVAEQSRIARADTICLAFPLFWWGMPSMMKGWVDRVWTWGWAYDQLNDPEKSHRSTVGTGRGPIRRNGKRRVSSGAGNKLDAGYLWVFWVFTTQACYSSRVDRVGIPAKGSAGKVLHYRPDLARA